LKAGLAADITPAKLRSGAPEALAGLCAHRGAAVFAYCRQAAGDDAAAVTADAFAEFRRAIQPPGSLTSGRQAEALLRGVTLRAALSYLRGGTGLFEPPPAAGCVEPDLEIVGYLENALAPAHHEAVAAHIAGCPSCAALLQRLQDAEPALAVQTGTSLPVPVAEQILTALVRAAPVGSHGGDETAVRDEAVRLLTGEEVSAAAPVEPPPAPLPAPPPPTPPLQPDPDPPQDMPAASASERAPRGPRFRLPSFQRSPFGPSRSAMLLRGVVKLVAVVAVASAAGIGLGVAIAELTGDDAAPTAPAVAPTSSTPDATTTTSAASVAATGKLRVEVLSATTDSAAQGARLTVRARVVNATGRAITPKPPSLLVDDRRVAVAPESSSTAAALLAPSLDTGATAEGTLRFDIPTASPSDLTTARVRMQLAGKFIVLNPKLAQPASAG
jgi:hypothetical protein